MALDNIENPRIVRELNEEYVEAGADIILANTFAANGAEVARSSSYTVEQVVRTAMKIAQDASNGRAKVGLAAGPLTGLLKPFGKISREEAKDMYEELIGAGMQEKPDLIYLLTFMDLEMLKIAAEAASHYDVPLLCSMSFMGANKNRRAREDFAHDDGQPRRRTSSRGSSPTIPSRSASTARSAPSTRCRSSQTSRPSRTFR